MKIAETEAHTKMTEQTKTNIVAIIFLALVFVGMYFYSRNVDRGIQEEYSQIQGK
jgi:hypothetical protein